MKEPVALSDEQKRLAVRAIKETLYLGGSSTYLPADWWIERAFLEALKAIGNQRTTPVLSDERAEFEKWIIVTYMGAADLRWTESRNCYDHFETHLAFQAWKARAILAATKQGADKE